MSTTGKSRIIALILVIAMVIGMVPTAAFASRVYPTPDKPEIAVGAVEAAAGDISFEETGTAEWGISNKTVTVTVDDEDGGDVTWAAWPTVTGASASITDVSGNTLTFTMHGSSDTTTDKVTISNIKYNVDAGAATGDVVVAIDISGITSDPADTANAEIVDGLSVAAVTKPDVTIGQNNQAAGNVTITESAAGLLSADKTFSITLPTGVTFYQAPSASGTNSLTLVNDVAKLSNGNKTATWTVDTVSSGSPSVITITNIKYNVDSTVAEGDIAVTVATDDTEPVNPSSVKNAAAVLTGAVTVSATAADISTGSNQAAGTVTITENTKGVLTADGTITLTLGGGITFAAAPTAEATNVDLVSTTATLNTTNYQVATWTLDGESDTAAATIKLKDIILNVPAGTTGAVQVTVGGTAGATGTKTIANIAVSGLATVEAETIVEVEKNAADQAAGDIIITEAAAGSLDNATSITLGIFGDPDDDKPIMFSKAPTVTVDDGNIGVGTVSLVDNVVIIDLTSNSTEASTIRVSGIMYDVTSAAEDGNIVVDVKYGTTRLGAVANAFIGELVVEPTFPDVAESHWAFEYIEGLVAMGIINGYTDGTFRPSNTITRAEFAKIACVAAGIDPISVDTPSFSDIDGHWAEGYIEAAKDAGIIGGYPDGTFRPNANVTRAEIAKMVVEAAGLAIDTSGAGFSDVAADHWAHDYILTAANNDIVGGYPDGTFRPNNSATRAEASKMVYVWVTTL